MNRENCISRSGLANFFQISPGTLGVWQTENRYKLPCKQIGTKVYYAWEDIYRFISFDEKDFKLLLKLGDKKPLLDRKSAADYLNCSVTTLRSGESQEAPIHPRYVGRVVRYRRAELDIYRKWRKKRRDTFIESRLNPFLFI
jgi:hypothetical protein